RSCSRSLPSRAVRVQAIEHRRDVALDLGGRDLHDQIAALLEPVAPRRTRLGSLLALSVRTEITHQPQRERDDVGDVAPDWRLPLEAVAGEAPVLRQRVPQLALRLGWVPAQESRQPTHRRALGAGAALVVLGQERAQHLGLLAIE